MKTVAIAAVLLLSACAHTPDPTYRTIKVAAPVSCVPAAAPGAPEGVETPDALAALADGPTRYARLAAAYLALWGWSLTAAPVIEACRTAASP